MKQLHSTIEANAEMSRKEMRRAIRTESALEILQTARDDQIDSAIVLCLRIWTMVDFRNPGDGLVLNGSSSYTGIVWDDDAGSLKSFLYRLFVAPSPAQDASHLHGRNPESFTRSRTPFTARNLKNLALVSIEPTNSLSDHLHYVIPNKRVFIFHYTAFLHEKMAMRSVDGENPV